MTHDEEVRERLLDMIHMVTDKNLRTLTKEQDLFIDWDAVAAAMKPDGHPDAKCLLKPIPIPCDTTSVDDPCGMKDAPKTVTAIREDINKLICDHIDANLKSHKSATMTNFEVELYRLLGIVEQVVMTLETMQKSTSNWPTAVYTELKPLSWIPPASPCPSIPWTPYPPSTSDPFPGPFPGSTTCSTEARAINKKVNEIERAILTAQTERGPQC